MRELNVDFADLYKEVDNFIKDAYSSEHGVSEYLRQMEAETLKGRRLLSAWDTDYKELKRLRWIRNQLSHEVGYDSDITEEFDYDWLKNFRARLYSSSAPLSVLRKAEESEKQKRVANRRTAGQNNAEKTVYYPYDPVNIEFTKQKTFWQKIKEFFTGK